MASKYMWFGWIGALAAATLSLTAPSYATIAHNQTIATNDPGWGNVIVISYSHFDRAFDFAVQPAIAADHRVDRAHISERVLKPFSIKQRASRAAVRPTSVAGWRSGRTRYLAAG